MATHSNILAWRVPGMAEPGGLPSLGSHRVGHDWSDLAAAEQLFGTKQKFFFSFPFAFFYVTHRISYYCSLELSLNSFRKYWRINQSSTSNSITDSMDLSLSKLQEIVKDREAWCSEIHGSAKSLTHLRDWTIATVTRNQSWTELLFSSWQIKKLQKTSSDFHQTFKIRRG